MLAASSGISGLAAALHRSAEIDQSLGLPVLGEALFCDERTPFCCRDTRNYGTPSYPRCGRM